MHPSEAGRNEVKFIGSTMGIIDKVKQRADNKEMDSLKTNIQDIKSAQQFVEKQLPTLPPEAAQNKEGYYSPAHAMDNALFYAAQLIENGDPTKAANITAAADQAQRLARSGTTTFNRDGYIATNWKKVSSTELGNTELTNIVDVPRDWKESKEGTQFWDQIKNFATRRSNNEKITAEDITLLIDAQKLILTAFKDSAVSKTTTPISRDLIYINLGILRMEAEKSIGQNMPTTPRVASAFQLTKGLYHHDSGTEREQKSGNPNYKGKGPTVIDLPHSLLTSG